MGVVPVACAAAWSPAVVSGSRRRLVRDERFTAVRDGALLQRQRSRLVEALQKLGEVPRSGLRVLALEPTQEVRELAERRLEAPPRDRDGSS